MSTRSVVDRPIDELRPARQNARTHSPKQIRQIAASIREFGFVNPVLVDGEDWIVAGHGRVAAAKQLGMTTVPTLVLDHLSPEQVRAYVIADNRLAELAGWDRDLLATELCGLMDLELDFDIEVTGFELPEIDLLVQEQDTDSTDDPTADALPEPLSDPPVTRPGDLWRLGEHRLLCGDARDAAAYRKLMGHDRASMMFTDPPYNVPIERNVCGLGSVRHSNFAMASGELSETEFIGFLQGFLDNSRAVCADGAIQFACIDWRHIFELLSAGRAVDLDLLNLCVWVKPNGGMGSLYRSRHELVACFKCGTGKHTNNIELGRFGRNRTNVWEYAGMNSLSAERDAQLRLHPTVKPVAMVADALLDCSPRGSIVLDPFGGSGTLLIAAEKVRRRARLLEIDPGYCDVAVRRWQDWSGECAVHEASGRAFPEIAEEQAPAERAASNAAEHGNIPSKGGHR